jgi:NitT/TauT family transport system ATP-binding protein
MPPASEPNPLLKLEGVTKDFPGTQALAGASFDAPRGALIALLGPSGCGKSTLLRLVAGLDTPTAGAIRWPGLESGAPAPGDIGFVFQEPTLMPWASVEENIALPLSLLKRGEPKPGAIAALIKSVGLEGFERTLPRALSGGMRMRASLARALLSEPRVLLLDEPFGALDEITREALNDALLELKASRDLTTLFVTHSVFESVYLADQVLVFSPRPGRIAARFDIEAPQTRADGFRFTPQYTEQCREVSAALARAMEGRHVA